LARRELPHGRADLFEGQSSERYWSTMERHKLYVSEHGEDMPEVKNWAWTAWQRTQLVLVGQVEI
jgi:hypothetical protein